MKRYVVDASVMGPLLFDDEAAQMIASLPSALASGDCVAPIHWRLEVANQILFGARRGRVKPDEVDLMLAAVANFPVEIDQESLDKVWDKSYALAAINGLTIYDAAYLEVALRLRLPLATFDKALTKAANENGVSVISA